MIDGYYSRILVQQRGKERRLRANEKMTASKRNGQRYLKNMISYDTTSTLCSILSHVFIFFLGCTPDYPVLLATNQIQCLKSPGYDDEEYYPIGATCNWVIKVLYICWWFIYCCLYIHLAVIIVIFVFNYAIYLYSFLFVSL